MFLEPLSRIAGRIPGTRALSLVGDDGMAVESIGSEAGTSAQLDELAAEVTAQARQIGTSHEELAAGEVRHLSVITETHAVLLSRVTSSYWLLLVGAPELPLGRARFELRRASLALAAELI